MMKETSNDTIPLYSKTSSDCEYALQQKSKSNSYKIIVFYGFLISLMLVSFIATSNLLFTKNDTESSPSSIESSFIYLPPYSLEFKINDNEWKIDAESDIEEFDWTEITK